MHNSLALLSDSICGLSPWSLRTGNASSVGDRRIQAVYFPLQMFNSTKANGNQHTWHSSSERSGPTVLKSY